MCEHRKLMSVPSANRTRAWCPIVRSCIVVRVMAGSSNACPFAASWQPMVAQAAAEPDDSADEKENPKPLKKNELPLAVRKFLDNEAANAKQNGLYRENKCVGYQDCFFGMNKSAYDDYCSICRQMILADASSHGRALAKMGKHAKYREEELWWVCTTCWPQWVGSWSTTSRVCEGEACQAWIRFAKASVEGEFVQHAPAPAPAAPMSAAAPPPGPPPATHSMSDAAPPPKPPPATQSMSAAAPPLKSPPSSPPVLYPTPRMDATELMVGQLQEDLKVCRNRVYELENRVGKLQDELEEMSTWWW